jgi:hypothetical protein
MSEWFRLAKSLSRLEADRLADLCPQCGKHRPDDERVKTGMKCFQCAYWTGLYQDPRFRGESQ